MSPPAVYREKGFRFHFFAKEESRMHIHVTGSSGEAKFWIEPEIALATSHGLAVSELVKLEKSIREHEDEIRTEWKRFFSKGV